MWQKKEPSYPEPIPMPKRIDGINRTGKNKPNAGMTKMFNMGEESQYYTGKDIAPYHAIVYNKN